MPTPEREPKGAAASDHSGERSARIVSGVGLGTSDRMPGRDKSHVGKHEGNVGEFNGGRKAGDCYSHDRLPHAQG